MDGVPGRRGGLGKEVPCELRPSHHPEGVPGLLGGGNPQAQLFLTSERDVEQIAVPDGVVVQGLEKRFGSVAVLRGLNLSIRRGEVVSIFGPNGAGKTTLLRILANLTLPDAGTIRVYGHDTADSPEFVRAITGVVLHHPLLYGDLTVRENLLFVARMFRIPDAERRVEWTAERMQMQSRLDDRVRTLSHGLQKRAAIARALLHSPKLLLLDEPEAGLDQRALALLDGVLSEFRSAGGTAVITTHALERGLAVSDRIAIIGRGRVVYLEEGSRVDPATVGELYRRYGEEV